MRSDFLEELVRRSDVVAVATELGLEVRGTKCRCLRPEAHAHGDRTPSLWLNRRGNTFRCWVCPDIHGSVIDLVMLARGCTFPEAVRHLAARAGLTVPDPSERAAPPGRFGSPQKATSPVPAALGPAGLAPRPPNAPFRLSPDAPADPPPVDDERAHAIFSFFLRWCDRPAPSHYLVRQRRISVETVQRMRIVQVHDAAGIEARLRREFTVEELVGSGLFSRWGLLFRHYPVVFPFTRKEQVRFLQGRRVDTREPKYLSISRPIPCLYNHDALDQLDPGAAVLLCEGAIDTLTWLDWGLPAVGILGVGTFKEEWIEALRPFRVLLCLDADEPGQRLARQLRGRFVAAGVQASIVGLPEGIKDVNQLAVQRPELVEEFLRGRVPGGR